MADIKTRKVDRNTIKTLDRAASAMHHVKEASIRMKAAHTDTSREREDDGNSNAYAQRKIENAAVSAAYATKTGAEHIQRQVSEFAKEGKDDTWVTDDEVVYSTEEYGTGSSGEQQIAFRSDELIHYSSERPEVRRDPGETNRQTEHVDPATTKNSQKHPKSYRPVQQHEAKTARNSRKPFEDDVKDPQDPARAPVVRRDRRYGKTGKFPDHPDDRSSIRGYTAKTNEELIRERGKNHAITKIRANYSVSGFWRVIGVDGKRNSGRTASKAGKVIRDMMESAKALFATATTGTAIALIIVIVLLFCGTAFTMTGDENGDYFAYDIYGIGPGDTAIVKVAEAQLGNVGGDKFWKWMGFTGRVEWCACFVSWCADQCGYIKEGIIPKYAVCGDGANWFKTHHRWASAGYSPKPGDIIFFDFERDGKIDHTGIVESCDGKTLTTIEGNVSDVCRRLTHSVGSRQIAGYGVPGYNSGVISGNASAWAAMIAGDNSYHYVRWNQSDSRTHECPVCNDHPAGAYRGWNCIGFAFACWHHGAGIRCRCSCGVIDNGAWNRLLSYSSDAEASRLATRLVGVPCTVIRNGGNAIPLSMLKKGDILGLYNGSGYYHTIFYEGDGKYADCTSGRSDNIQAGNTLPARYKSQIKIAIRYIG